jgi:single-strand DNA-binding protein
MAYLNSITPVGFVGSDPEQRQAKGNGSKFTVLSVATQRSWKNADDEWSSKTEWHRIVVFRPLLAERVATTKGAHLLVEGSLVSSTYEQPNGKGSGANSFTISDEQNFLGIIVPFQPHWPSCPLSIPQTSRAADDRLLLHTAPLH